MPAASEYVIDASVLLAVLLDEETAPQVIEKTRGSVLFAPACVRWEIGNACSSFLKQNRMDLLEVQDLIELFYQIPLQELDVDLSRVMELCAAHRIYAYDAYYLEAARKQSRPLLTLDVRMRDVALKEGIKLEDI